jgi:hypothetical protein
MQMKERFFWRGTSALAVIVLAACGSSGGIRPVDGAIKPLHLLPQILIVDYSDDVNARAAENMLGYSIGEELAKRGYRMFDPEQMSRVLTQSGLSRAQLKEPGGLVALEASGIGAVMYVSVVPALGSGNNAWGMSGTGGLQSATVKLVGRNGLVAGVEWESPSRGRTGSPADLGVRKGFAAASQEIAEAIASQLAGKPEKAK